MDLTPVIPKNANVINGYGAGYFLLNNKKIFSDILVSAYEIVEITEADYTAKLPAFIAKNQIELLLIGSDNDLRLENLPVLHEAMPSAAACRTYNVLMTEGRNVAALIFRM
jgi:uncharacterized protein